MKKRTIQNEIDIHCGKNTDSMEHLAMLCEKEAEKLVKTLDLAEEGAMSVPFWTEGTGFPELICVGKFKRDETGKIVYELDFSESTL